MPKRPRRSRDSLQAAHLAILGKAPALEPEQERSPAAVSLGRLA